MLPATDMGLLHYEVSMASSIGLSAYEAQVEEWVRTTTRAGSWAREAVDRRRASIMIMTAPTP